MVFLWGTMYGVVYALASGLQNRNPWTVPLAMLGYTAGLVFWILRTGQAQRLGLCAFRWGNMGGLCRYLPLLMLPLYNLLTAKAFCTSIPTIVLMLAVCAAEEVFFRGFLLRYLMRFGTPSAVIVSSGIFALFHLVNLTEGCRVTYIWTQVAAAFAVGLCYGIGAVQSGSLIPGFLGHFLTNITAAPVANEPSPFLWLCIGLHGIYGIFWIWHYHRNKEKQL